MKKNFYTLFISVILFGILTNVFAQKKTLNHILKKSNQTERLQTIGYNFIKTTGTYNNLTGATSVNDTIWDDPEYIIQIGFTFKLFDKNITKLYMGLGLGGAFGDTLDMNSTANYLTFPFETDLQDRGAVGTTTLSPIMKKTEGSIGSRIFKLEFKNAGFYNEMDSLGVSISYVNFQMWLYEGTNIIEFRYGPSLINNPILAYSGTSGPLIGFIGFKTSTFYLLEGPAANPLISNNYSELTGTPPDGTIYTFSPVILENSHFDSDNAFRVFPNPASDIINIELKKTKSSLVKIFDITGKELSATLISEQKTSLNISSLKKGLYLITTEYNGIKQTQKFIKK